MSLIRKPQSSLDNNQLIEQCKNGERRAQYELFQSYAKAMFNVVQRMTNDKALSEEIVQESFIKVFKKIGQFKGDSTLGAWIKRICINTALNTLRGRKIMYDLPEQLPDKVEEEDEHQDFGISANQIHREVKKLPQGSREIVCLYLLEGYKHKEIAELLKISESTSRSQYMRGKNILKENLIRLKTMS